MASGGLRLAGGVRRLQRQPIQRTRGGEVYSRPRAAPPHDFPFRGIPRLPEGASDPLRRAVYLGVASAVPAGAAHAADALAPTAHAVGYSSSALRPDKHTASSFIKRHQMLGSHAKPATVRNVDTPGHAFRRATGTAFCFRALAHSFLLLPFPCFVALRRRGNASVPLPGWRPCASAR